MSKYDFYDEDKAEKLRDQHCQKGIDLLRRLSNAREKGDMDAVAKAKKALVKHKVNGEQCRQKANEAGCYWYS